MFIRMKNPKQKCVCEECGKTFIKKTPTQIYCSDECRIKVQRRQIRIYNGFKEKQKPVIVKPKKKFKIKKRKCSFGLYTRHK